MIPEFYQYQCPTKIVYGVGLSKDFAIELEILGVKKLFVVTDQVLADLKLTDPILEGIQSAELKSLRSTPTFPPILKLGRLKKLPKKRPVIRSMGSSRLAAGVSSIRRRRPTFF